MLSNVLFWSMYLDNFKLIKVFKQFTHSPKCWLITWLVANWLAVSSELKKTTTTKAIQRLIHHFDQSFLFFIEKILLKYMAYALSNWITFDNSWQHDNSVVGSKYKYVATVLNKGVNSVLHRFKRIFLVFLHNYLYL